MPPKTWDELSEFSKLQLDALCKNLGYIGPASPKYDMALMWLVIGAIEIGRTEERIARTLVEPAPASFIVSADALKGKEDAWTRAQGARLSAMDFGDPRGDRLVEVKISYDEGGLVVHDIVEHVTGCRDPSLAEEPAKKPIDFLALNRDMSSR